MNHSPEIEKAVAEMRHYCDQRINDVMHDCQAQVGRAQASANLAMNQCAKLEHRVAALEAKHHKG